MHWFDLTSIQRKLVWIIMGTTCAALLLASAGFLLNDVSSFRNSVVEAVERRARVVGNASRAAMIADNKQLVQIALVAAQEDPRAVAIVVYRPDGSVFAKYVRSDRQAAYQPPAPAPDGHRFVDGDLIVHHRIVFDGKHAGDVVVQVDMSMIRERFARNGGIAAGVVVGTVMMAFLLSTALQRRVSGPILRLTGLAREVGATRNYSLRAPKQGADELGQLTDGFNSMLDQIQARDAALQQAHDDLEQRVVQRTAELSKANELLTREIGERKEAESRTAAFSTLGQKLSAANTPEEAGRLIADVAQELLGWDACSLALYSGKQSQVLPLIAVDTVEGRRVDVPPPSYTPTPMMLRVKEQGAQLILRQHATDGSEGLMPFGNTARRSASLLFVPIHNNGVFIGAFSIQSYAPQAYDGDDLNTLQALADHCAGALERLDAERRLHLSEERFAKAFRTSPIAIGMVSATEWRFVDVNDAFLRLFEYRREDMLGRTPLELGLWLQPGDFDKLRHLLERHQHVRDLDSRFRGKSGTVHNTLLSVESIESSDDRCLLLTVYDVTERLDLEAQLRQSQKMEAVGQLAAGVAHDFNNILTVIQGHASLLREAGLTAHEVVDSSRQIGDAAERAANLTRQLLAFSRKQIMQPKVLDLNTVVGNAYKMLHRLLGEDVSLQCAYGPHLPAVLADEAMLGQVILNLAVNARDAMPRGGILTISTDAVDVTEGTATQHTEARPGRFVRLSVHDTGCGMDSAIMAHIFEPFFTTKEVGKGTGLGLATVYGIVKQHQGWIEVSSVVGKGSTFRILLPVAPEKEKPARPENADGAALHGAGTILVAEDEPALCLLVCTTLRRAGYTVHAAASGVEALKVWHGQRGCFDLLLTDMVMPGGVSGRDLAVQLLAEKPALKVIYTSGYSMELVEADFALEDGVNFLQKPYQPASLLRVVREQLRERDGTV
ncbi:MAG: ATP-binding protein [Verrucomicrobiota bacterium]